MLESDFKEQKMNDDPKKGSAPRSIDRRRLLRGITIGTVAVASSGTLGRATTGFAAEAAEKDRVFTVTTVNHLSYASKNYKVTRDFYVSLFNLRDVWDDGTKCQLDCGPEAAPNSFYVTAALPGKEPTIGHYAFGLPDYWKLTNALRDELMRRKFPGVHPDGEAGWFVNGPSGYVQHITAVKDSAMFPGAAKPCAVARSETCKEAYAVGLKSLDDVPKPDGKGFKALYFRYIVLRVPDVAREAEFYVNLMGMMPAWQKPEDVGLRFGENTLVIRSSGADRGPSVNEFGFVVENYDEAKVKAELAHRGIASAPNPDGGLMIRDPNGLQIGIGGRS
jgi:catechol 2,3-dioxygenase-like lactoylglutathione lyase family enzyme